MSKMNYSNFVEDIDEEITPSIVPSVTFEQQLESMTLSELEKLLEKYEKKLDYLKMYSVENVDPEKLRNLVKERTEVTLKFAKISMAVNHMKWRM